MLIPTMVDQTGSNAYKSDKAWWDVDNALMAQAISSTLASLSPQAEARAERYTVGERVYGTSVTDVVGASANGSVRRASVEPTANYVSGIVDTLVSRFSRSRPRIRFLTDNGKTRSRQRAKAMTAYTDAYFSALEAYDTGYRVIRDAIVYGDGYAVIGTCDNQPTLEKVLPHEIYVDEVETVYGKPTQYHRVRGVDRQSLIAQFPEHEGKIRMAQAVRIDGATTGVADLILLRESWRVSTSPDAEDGTYVISIETTLLQEPQPYKHVDPPIIHLTWQDPMIGWSGTALTEQLRPLQVEINHIDRMVNKSAKLGGTPKVITFNGSKLSKHQLTNAVWDVWSVDGDKPPMLVTPDLINPNWYSLRAERVSQMLMVAGVSQLALAGQKPAGVTSGVGIREVNDIEELRFLNQSRKFDAFFRDIAYALLRTAQDIKDETGKYPSAGLATLDGIDLSKMHYEIAAFSTSSLPRDPAGRLSTIQEYAQAGYLDPLETQRLISYPDLSQVETLRASAEEYVLMCLDKIVEEGIITTPDPDVDDLPKALSLSIQYINDARMKKVAPDRINLLFAYMDQVKSLMAPPALDPAMQALPAPQAAPTGLDVATVYQ
jgi:hypothetical protein